MTGWFITFEGGEGTGKSTQARRLAERLSAAAPVAGGKPREVVLTREPGGAPLAERIRDLVLANPAEAPASELLLFAAARSEHLAVTIRPALARGAIVICDRFIDSTRVYQGDLLGVDTRLIAALEQLTVAPTLPDLTLVLDLDPAAGLARAAARGALSRYDAALLDQHQVLRKGFCDVAAAEPRRCVLIDADGDEATVAARIWQAVSARLPDDLQRLA